MSREEHALRNALQAATPGPWHAATSAAGRSFVCDGDGREVAVIRMADPSEGRANAQAISAMRNAVQPMLAELRALRAERQALVALRDAVGAWIPDGSCRNEIAVRAAYAEAVRSAPVMETEASA